MFNIQVFDIPSKHDPNSRGEAPFIYNRRMIHFVKLKDYMPKYYVHDKKLWQLVHGMGSTYYIPSRTIQVLPMLGDGAFENEDGMILWNVR